MTDPVTHAANTPIFTSFTLDQPIFVGASEAHPAGTEIKVRRPSAGELRGVNISALISSCDYLEVERLAPRITTPTLHKQAIAAMAPADFVQLGGEIVDFLLPKAVKQAASQDA